MHPSTLTFILPIAFLALPQAPTDLTKVLEQADQRRQEYIETFKDLTALETKVTEIFDRKGKVDKKRTVVSDFLVYQSDVPGDVAREYRLPREVDGKSVGKPNEDAVKLFEKLAKAKTLRQQFDQFRDQTLKYTLHYFRWGITLEPFTPIEKRRQTSLQFEILGREGTTGRETIVLGYRQKERTTAPSRGILAKFKTPHTWYNGRIWVDAETGRVRRWENDAMVTDQEITKEAVLVRDLIEYEPSPFDILIPKTIVTSFFDKAPAAKANQPLRLAGRITYTYEDFKRFDVQTKYEIQQPRQDR